MHRPSILALTLVALLAAGELAADVVRLKNGRTLEGKVREIEGDKIELSLPYGSLAFERDLVDSVERSDTVGDIVAARLAELAADDAEGLYQLALYCREESAYTLAGRLLEEVLYVDPDHAAARRDLGYVLDGEEWVREEELRRRRGEVFFRGAWVPAEERRRLLTLEAAIQTARRGSELERARLEVELARLEAELERRTEPRNRAQPEGIPLYPGYGGPNVYGQGLYGPGAYGQGGGVGSPQRELESEQNEAIERQLERRRTSAAANPGPRHRRGRLAKP